EGSSVPFLTHLEGFRGYLTPRFNANVNEWRARSIFRSQPKDIKRLEVTDHKTPENSFLIEMVGGDILLKDYNAALQEFDTGKVRLYLRLFQNINYEGFEETKEPEFIDSVKSSVPLYTFKVIDQNGEQSISTYLKPNNKGANNAEGVPFPHDMDRMYGLLNDKDFVVVQYQTFDPITQTINYFK
ncbi:MAG: hypothetical protein MRY83_00335, partial [Flavobacteriales bacterium]|nr:hypothetical protein [Flavobacteriales bacterium]